MDRYPWFDFDQVDFVTSDTHFSHARISELADRPFATIEEMDAELIRRWNEVVSPDDVVLHLGDVALGSIDQSLPLTAQLNGRRFLIPGNHDRVSPATQSRRAVERFTPAYEAAGWTILPEVVEGPRNGHFLRASHYPYQGDTQETERHSAHRPHDDGVPLIHGHTHARGHCADGRQFHVGVDAHGYAPIPFTVVDAWLETLPDVESRLQAAIREARTVMNGFENTPWPEMDALFYTQGYNELQVVLDELLNALKDGRDDGE